MDRVLVVHCQYLGHVGVILDGLDPIAATPLYHHHCQDLWQLLRIPVLLDAVMEPEYALMPLIKPSCPQCYLLLHTEQEAQHRQLL